MPSLGTNDCTMNGPAPTGLRLNAVHWFTFAVAVHTRFNSVGEGIMLASSDNAYWNELHGSLSVIFNVVVSTTWMSLTSAMYTPDEVPLRGQAQYFAQSAARDAGADTMAVEPEGNRFGVVGRAVAELDARTQLDRPLEEVGTRRDRLSRAALVLAGLRVVPHQRVVDGRHLGAASGTAAGRHKVVEAGGLGEVAEDERASAHWRLRRRRARRRRRRGRLRFFAPTPVVAASSGNDGHGRQEYESTSYAHWTPPCRTPPTPRRRVT